MMTATGNKSDDIKAVVTSLESIGGGYFPTTLHSCAGKSILAKVCAFRDMCSEKDGALFPLYSDYCDYDDSDYFDDKFSLSKHLEETIPVSHVFQELIVNHHHHLPVELWNGIAAFAGAAVGSELQQLQLAQELLPLAHVCARKTNKTWAVLADNKWTELNTCRWSNTNVARYWAAVLRGDCPSSARFKNDKEMSDFVYASEQLKNDKAFVLTAIDKNSDCFLYASEQLKNDKAFVLTAIDKNPNCIEYASKELKNDRDLILTAIDKNPDCFRYASEESKKDRDFVLAAVNKDSLCLPYASDSLKNDGRIVLAAINKDPLCFGHASEELKNDKEFVLAAVKQHPMCLLCASVRLRNDREVVLLAMNKDPSCLQYASEQLKIDQDMIHAQIEIQAKQRLQSWKASADGSCDKEQGAQPSAFVDCAFVERKPIRPKKVAPRPHFVFSASSVTPAPNMLPSPAGFTFGTPAVGISATMGSCDDSAGKATNTCFVNPMDKSETAAGPSFEAGFQAGSLQRRRPKRRTAR